MQKYLPRIVDYQVDGQRFGVGRHSVCLRHVDFDRLTEQGRRNDENNQQHQPVHSQSR